MALSLAEDCLVKLREYVASLGGSLEGEWKCRAQMRDTGSRAGSVDMWFRAPGGEVYRSKVAVARGLGLMEAAEPKPTREKAPRQAAERTKARKPRQSSAQAWNNSPSWPGSGELTVRDLAELLMSMPEGEPDGRYQGRLTWKGKANVRNPAIAVALEIMLESLRGGSSEAEEAGPSSSVEPVALPVRVAPVVPPCAAGGPSVIMSFELPPGSTIPEAAGQQQHGAKEEHVSVQISIAPEGEDSDQPVQLTLQVLPGQQRHEAVTPAVATAGSSAAAHPAPLALATIPVVKSEEAPPPLTFISSLRHATQHACNAAAACAGHPQPAAAAGKACRATAITCAATGSEHLGAAEGAAGMEVEMGEAGHGFSRAVSPEDGSDVEVLPVAKGVEAAFAQQVQQAASAAAAAAEAPEPGPMQHEAGEGPHSMEGDSEDESGGSPVSGMSGLDESVADALLGLPDAPPPSYILGGHVLVPAAAAGQGGGGGGSSTCCSPLLRPPRPSSESLRGKSPEEVEVALMERLRKYVHELGHELPPGWTVRASVRKTGVSAGGIDAYYYAPGGKRVKSMVKVAEALGLGTAPSPLPAPKAYMAFPHAPAGAAAVVAGGGHRDDGDIHGRGMGALPGRGAPFPLSPQPPNSHSQAFFSPDIDQQLAFPQLAVPGGGPAQPMHAPTLPNVQQQKQQGGAMGAVLAGEPQQQQPQGQPAGGSQGMPAGAAGQDQQQQGPLPPLQAHDVAQALAVAQALRPLRVPGQSPGVGRLGRRDQLLAGRKRRRSLEAAAGGGPGSPGDDGDSSSDEDEGSVDEDSQSDSGINEGEEGSEGTGAEAEGASSSPGRSQPGPPPGGRPVGLPGGGVDVASVGGGQAGAGEATRRSKRAAQRRAPGRYGGAGGGSAGHGPGGGAGGNGSGGAGGGGEKPGGGGKGDKDGAGKRSHKKSHKKQAKRQRRTENDKVVNNYDRMFNRLRSQLSRLRQEQALVEAYAADGWRGASREKVKPTAEIKRAKEQIKRIKEVIRECVRYCDEAEGDKPIPAELFDETGELDLDYIFCSKCKLNHADDDNDIILCDGPCNRAYHVKCLVPPVDPEALPEDEGWLCPACDRKIDMVDLINDEFGTEYELETPWETILAPGTLPKSPNANVPGSPRAAVDLGRLEGLLEGADLPSEDEDDEDYVESSSSDEEGGGRGSGGSGGSSDSSGGDSDSEGDSEGGSGGPGSEDEDEEGLRGEMEELEADGEGEERPAGSRGRSRGSARGGRGEEEGEEEEEEASGRAEGAANGAGEADPSLILAHKRRRAVVDYRALNAEMFGDMEVHGGEFEEEEAEDEVWSPRTQKAAAKIPKGDA